MHLTWLQKLGSIKIIIHTPMPSKIVMKNSFSIVSILPKTKRLQITTMPLLILVVTHIRSPSSDISSSWCGHVLTSPSSSFLSKAMRSWGTFSFLIIISWTWKTTSYVPITQNFHVIMWGKLYFVFKKNYDATRQEVSHMFITCLSGIVLVAKGKLKRKDVERILSGKERRWQLLVLFISYFIIIWSKRGNRTWLKKCINFSWWVSAIYVDRCSWHCFACDSIHVFVKTGFTLSFYTSHGDTMNSFDIFLVWVELIQSRITMQISVITSRKFCSGLVFTEAIDDLFTNLIQQIFLLVS